MPAKICFILLFILAFLIAPFGVTEFENPKVIVAEAGILLLLFYFLFTKKNTFRLPQKQVMLYSLLLLVTVIDLLFLRTPISFFGNVFRMQGIYLLWLLLLFSILSASVTFKSVAWYWYGLLLLIESIVVFFLPLNASQRFVGTLGEPNALGAYVIFLWPFAYFGIKKYGMLEKAGSILIFFMVILLIFLTGSISALLAFIVQIVCIFLYKKKIAVKKIVFICLFIYACSYVLPFFENNPYENRVEVWQSAVVAGFTNPILGNGFGNSEFALHKSAKQLGLPIQYYYVDSAHNIFLDWLVQAGVVGFIVLCYLVYLSINKFVQTGNFRELVLIFGMIIVLSFNPASIIGLLGFWWLIGQGLKA